jgi:hypothetical protein
MRLFFCDILVGLFRSGDTYYLDIDYFGLSPDVLVNNVLAIARCFVGAETVPTAIGDMLFRSASGESGRLFDLVND